MRIHGSSLLLRPQWSCWRAEMPISSWLIQLRTGSAWSRNWKLLKVSARPLKAQHNYWLSLLSWLSQTGNVLAKHLLLVRPSPFGTGVPDTNVSRNPATTTNTRVSYAKTPVFERNMLDLATALLSSTKEIPSPAPPLQPSVTTAGCPGTLPVIVAKESSECEIDELLLKGAIEKVDVAPVVLNPLQVVARGQASLRSGHLSATVAKAQFEGLPTHTCMPLSNAEIGGERKSALLATLQSCENMGLRRLWQDLASRLMNGRAKSTIAAYKAASIRRSSWLDRVGLPDNPSGVLIYLSDRAANVGPSSLALELAAFKFCNDPPESPTLKLASLIVSGAARTGKKEPTPAATEDNIREVIKWYGHNDSVKNHRGVVAVLLSWVGLLRVSEAANLKWGDLRLENDRLELTVKRAKNDQLAKGRSTFVEYKSGGTLHCIIEAWRNRQHQPPTEDAYVLANLNNGAKMSEPALAKEAKRIMQEAGCPVSLTHHALRRGSAQSALAAGVGREQIQQRGRWRSANGMNAYLKDCVEGQGGLSTLPDSA